MFCQKCGTELPANSRFCSACGAGVPMLQTQVDNYEKKVVHKQSDSFITTNIILSVVALLFMFSSIAPMLGDQTRNADNQDMMIILPFTMNLIACVCIWFAVKPSGDRVDTKGMDLIKSIEMLAFSFGFFIFSLFIGEHVTVSAFSWFVPMLLLPILCIRKISKISVNNRTVAEKVMYAIAIIQIIIAGISSITYIIILLTNN